MANGTETVTLKLPSGEMVDAVVPSGMPDAAIQSLMRQKHPEYFNAAPKSNLTPQQQMNKALSASPTQFELERNPQFQQGWAPSFIDSLKQYIPSGQQPTPYYNMAAPVGSPARNAMQNELQQASQNSVLVQDTQRKAVGRSVPYRAVAAAASLSPIPINVQGMERGADIGNPSAIVGAAAGSAAPAAIAPAVQDAFSRPSVPSKISQMMKEAPSKVTATPEAEMYSKPGDLVASSLRSNARVDLPAESNIAHPAIKEAMADKGYTPDMFTGRNGPQLFKDAVGHAIDLTEARKAQVMEPIKGETVDPKILVKNPELAAQFPEGRNVTYGELMQKLSDLNKQLANSNFYTKDISKQVSAVDPIQSVESAANQARSVLYDYASKRTGIDLRPMQRQESALIKIQDTANTTANQLSMGKARFEATPTYQKALQSARNIVSMSKNPVSALSGYEKPGLTDPTKTFNSNIRRAFFDVQTSAANTAMNVQSLPQANPLGQLGFDPNANPGGVAYPDALPEVSKPNLFGFDESAGVVPSGLPDVVKRALAREAANTRAGYPKTGVSRPKRTGR